MLAKKHPEVGRIAHPSTLKRASPYLVFAESQFNPLKFISHSLSRCIHGTKNFDFDARENLMRSYESSNYGRCTKDGDGSNFGFLLKQGAEARISALTLLGRRSIVKERFTKNWWHPTVKLLKEEARFMTKARRLGVLTPTLYAVDPLLHTLTFEYIEGPPVKDVLLDFVFHGVNEEKLNDIALQIGNAIGKLHDGGIVHGNLRTSNMIIQRGTNQLVLIDFGASFTSTDPEDKAVDLYVLERALLPMKSSCGNVMDRILAAYKKSSRQPGGTLNKLAQERGRSEAHDGGI